MTRPDPDSGVCVLALAGLDEDHFGFSHQGGAFGGQELPDDLFVQVVHGVVGVQDVPGFCGQGSNRIRSL